MKPHSMSCEFPEGCSCGAAEFNALEQQNVTLRAALEDISTTAHCLAKAGPLNTPDLASAWGHFMQISVMATSALGNTRHPEGITEKLGKTREEQDRYEAHKEMSDGVDTLRRQLQETQDEIASLKGELGVLRGLADKLGAEVNGL